jgi:hypothetical protein
MKRKVLVPNDEDWMRNDEIERINRKTRKLEEEAAHAERLREATAARDAAQERLQRIVGNNNVQISSGAFDEPKQEEPKVELQKVDTAKFVFAWENSSSVMDVAIKIHPNYIGASMADITLTRKLAEVIRTVEQIPLRELPDHTPKSTPGKINNLTLPKE